MNDAVYTVRGISFSVVGMIFIHVFYMCVVHVVKVSRSCLLVLFCCAGYVDSQACHYV